MNQADFQANTPFAQFGNVVADAPADARRAFIRKTYMHLMAAVYGFVAIVYLLFALGVDDMMLSLLGHGQWTWLIVLGAFMAVSWIADSWARSSTSLGMQYAGLFLYVLAEAIIFMPLLHFATQASVNFGGTHFGVIPAAAITTLLMFAGMTAIAFLTKKDFSFLGGILGIAGIGVFALIVIASLFGLSLGVWFMWAMVVFSCAYILYSTSNILHQYRTDQYVAAALALFASVALLFWYIIQIFMASRD
ncbi:MAG: Bax inhibitor-1 family protein [Pirellulales bacterium]